jgi:hypothetical protein
VKLVELKKCECGCDESVAVGNRFVNGHYGRIQPHSPPSLETRAKLSAALKGRPKSPETRARMSASRMGELHPQWKADPSYNTLHTWVWRHKVKIGKCSTCSYTGETEWANISGLYFRDLEDFAEMCVFCHREFDNMEMG